MKELSLEDKIKYLWRTERYGRAEFQICPKFVRGKMTDVFIYRRQQPHEKNKEYHLDLLKLLPKWRITEFQIDAWSHKTDNPRIWRNWWCKEHKTIAFDIYVPNDTDTIEFDFHFGDNLTIRFVKEDD